MNEIFKHRGSLDRVLRKIEEGNLTIGFIGGSITDQRSWNNWPEPVINWFADKFPEVRISVENAAIGATGSDLAVFRAQRDLIERNCDLVFIEYAVNDGGVPAEKRMRSREGLVRKLLAGEGRDLIFVYTHFRDMIPYYINATVPESIKDFEKIACHYNIGSVWMGLYAFQEVQKGNIRWEEWLPDGLHPDSRGSFVYGKSVTEFLEQELLSPRNRSKIKSGIQMPQPLNPKNWENTYLLPFSEVEFKSPFKLRRWTDLAWMDQAIETSAVGAQLSFTFEGRGLALGFDFGKLSSEYKYRLDGREWNSVTRERSEWCQTHGVFRLDTICDDLPLGRHTFDLEVAYGAESRLSGTRFCLGLIGVIK